MAEKPEDLSLPVGSVSRVINDALPANVNVSAETRKTIARAASVFVLYTTATAASMAQKAGRKTMNANDVMDAILDIDFPQFKEPMENFLENFRQAQKKKKETRTSAKKLEEKKSTTDAAPDDSSNVVVLSDSDD